MLLNGIEKVFKKRTLLAADPIGISLNIYPGEAFGILTRPGTGKSALIRNINLVEPTSERETIIESYDLTLLTTAAVRSTRHHIGMIFQHFNLLKSRNVFDNVALPLEFTHTPQAKIETTVRSLLDLTGLTDKSNAYPYQLSTEEKQRVCIARALATQPTILLCEEATAGLDFPAKQSILRLLDTIRHQLKLTLILITHELEVLKSLSNRVAVLDKGEIVEQGTILEIYSHPTSNLTKELIKAATLLEIPTVLRNRLSSIYRNHATPILRIAFKGNSLEDPFIAVVLQRYNLSVNIIQAHLETIQNHTIGVIIAEMTGGKAEVENAIQYLAEKDLYIEVLGYVLRTA